MWIEIFKTGIHTDSSGKSAEYSSETLDLISQIYNQRISEDPSFEAPIVKGHPASDDPAYGWVERLARRGTKLLAKIKDLQPEILDEVTHRKFTRLSIAIYPDMMLRHVGLLGAAAPAIKGLKPVSFASEDNFIEFKNFRISIRFSCKFFCRKLGF